MELGHGWVKIAPRHCNGTRTWWNGIIGSLNWGQHSAVFIASLVRMWQKPGNKAMLCSQVLAVWTNQKTETILQFHWLLRLADDAARSTTEMELENWNWNGPYKWTLLEQYLTS